MRTKQGSASTWLLPWLTVCWSPSYPRLLRAKNLLTSECEGQEFLLASRCFGEFEGSTYWDLLAIGFGIFAHKRKSGWKWASQVPDAGRKSFGALQRWDVQSSSPGMKLYKMTKWNVHRWSLTLWRPTAWTLSLLLTMYSRKGAKISHR